MMVGCYVADLYCDLYHVKHGEVSDSAGHRYDSFPDQFTGKTEQECKSQARRKGWTFRRNGQTICPLCSGKKEKPDAQ